MPTSLLARNLPGNSVIRQGKRQNGASGRNSKIFLPVQGIGYGGGINRGTRLEMPEVLTGLRIERDEISFHIPTEYESARSGEHAPERRGVEVEFPPDVSIQRVDSA